MQQELKRQFIISAIFVLLLFILIDLLVLNDRISKGNNLFYNKYIKEVEEQNKKAQKRIDSLQFLIEESNRKLTEISDKKDKIKAIYIENDKRIDTLSANGIVDEYKLFFSNLSNK